MKHRSISCKIIFSVLIAILFAAAGYAAQVTKNLAPGVVFDQNICTDPASALIVNTVKIDLAAQGVNIKAAVSQDVVLTDDWRKGRETVSSLTGRNNALVGVNADYFPYTGDMLGVCISDGELVSEPYRTRAALAFRNDNSVFFDIPRLNAVLNLPNGTCRQVDGINRVRETNQLIAYTERFGASTQNKYKAVDVVCTSADLPVTLGKTINLTVVDVKADALNTPIPKGGMVLSAGGPAGYFIKENVKPGDALQIRFDIRSINDNDWTQVRQAVGGGPWLVSNGRPFVDAVAEGFEATFASARHPRTAVGITADNKLLIVTVDGRQSISRGVSLNDLACLMQNMGAVTAINFDGGGSTTLSVKGGVVNSPSEGSERPVADALLVFAQPAPVEELPKLTMTGIGTEVPLGQCMQLGLAYGDDLKPLTPEQLCSVVWSTNGGIGFVNQSGYFIPAKIGSGFVNAVYGDTKVSMKIAVIAGAPARLDVTLDPDKNNPNVAAVKVRVYDNNNNLLPGKEVLLNIAGGAPDADSGVTNAKGEFLTKIKWDPAAVDKAATAVVGTITGESRIE